MGEKMLSKVQSLSVTLTLDFSTLKSNQFIFLTNCTKKVKKLVKFPHVVSKLSSSTWVLQVIADTNGYSPDSTKFSYISGLFQTTVRALNASYLLTSTVTKWYQKLPVRDGY